MAERELEVANRRRPSALHAREGDMHAACLSSAVRNKQEGRKPMTLRIESGLADRQLGNGDGSDDFAA